MRIAHASGLSLFCTSVALALSAPLARACLIHETTAGTLASNAYQMSIPRDVAAPDDNLGFKWKSEGNPAAFNVTLDAAKNTRRFLATTPMVPIKHEMNWNQLGPVTVNFMPASNPDVASPDPLSFFMYRMKIVNTTGVAWRGFSFTIVDGNNTNYPKPSAQEGGSLLHPDRAHFHIDALLFNQLGFTEAVAEQKYRNAQDAIVTNNITLAADEAITDQGIYKLTLTDPNFRVANNGAWEPMKYVPKNTDPDAADATMSSLLQIHDKIKALGRDPSHSTAFSVIFEPIAVPGPASAFALVGALSIMMTVRNGRTRRQ